MSAIATIESIIDDAITAVQKVQALAVTIEGSPITREIENLIPGVKALVAKVDPAAVNIQNLLAIIPDAAAFAATLSSLKFSPADAKDGKIAGKPADYYDNDG